MATDIYGRIQEIDEYFTGNIARVLSVSQQGREVAVRFRNGIESLLTSREATSTKRGDVLIVREQGWLKVPKRSWEEEPVIYIVRKVLPDRLLVESGNLTKTVPYKGNVELVAGNTIEYYEIDQSVALIAESPIRARDEGLLELDPAGPFEVKIENELSLDSFGGYESVVERASKILRLQLDQKDAIDAIGAKPIKGVIFSGPPGTGKTMLAQIIASTSKARFFVISGPQIVSKWVGESEAVLRSIFETAQDAEKAIIFFDEIDSVASRRTEDSHESSNRLVAQLLTLMDGAHDKKGNVVVVAATNRISEIDPALLRPGRFDWEINFQLPTLSDRYEILSKSGRSIATCGDLPFELVAEQTEGWSGAELSAIWTEAMLCALDKSTRSVSGEDFVEGFERAHMSREMKTTVVRDGK